MKRLYSINMKKLEKEKTDLLSCYCRIKQGEAAYQVEDIPACNVRSDKFRSFQYSGDLFMEKQSRQKIMIRRKGK